jgi:uncharacterized protein (TIGR01777 family)
MQILVSGSTGFVGSALIAALERDGHSVATLMRGPMEAGRAVGARKAAIRWDPVAGQFDAGAAEGAEALVHLAGASIASGRWNAARKELLRTSRIDATRQLMGALAKLQLPPKVIVAASAVGYYGNRGDEVLSETSAPGADFLAGLCQEWETEEARATEFGARVVHLRLGVILGAHGGALPQMALPFKLGVGGRIGDGKQWMSWLTLGEAVRIIQFALAAPAVAGPVNAVTPNPVRNAEFTKALAAALHRPALFPAPPFALRLALGEMADALLLSSQRVSPAALCAAGYPFAQPKLASALAEIFRH